MGRYLEFVSDYLSDAIIVLEGDIITNVNTAFTTLVNLERDKCIKLNDEGFYPFFHDSSEDRSFFDILRMNRDGKLNQRTFCKAFRFCTLLVKTTFLFYDGTSTCVIVKRFDSNGLELQWLRVIA